MKTPLPTVGIIGIGAMGWAMAERLHERGYPVAAVDVRAAPCQAARELGLQVCRDGAELAGVADIVLIVVVNAQQMDAVINAATGLLQASTTPQNPAGRRTHTVLLCSTISPGDSARLAGNLLAHGIAALDAPISGGPLRARAGSMSMMLAGPPATLDNCAVLLQDLAEKRFVISPVAGDAAKAKLVNNMLAGANLVAGAEALALAEKVGLDARQMYDIICACSGASWIFADRMARALADDFEPRAAAHILTKDVGLAAALAESVGHATPMADAALARFQLTLAGGWSELDDGAVIKTWQAPTQVPPEA
jgi:3-hydroxyisobutyrate dehydrogenase